MATGPPFTASTPVAKQTTHAVANATAAVSDWRRRAGREPDQPHHRQRHADQHGDGGQPGQHRHRPGPAGADRVAEHADPGAEVGPVPHRLEVPVEDAR